MVENKERNDEHSAQPAQQRKPYEKPEIVYWQPLEAAASVCSSSPGPGKSGPTCSVAFS